MEISDRSETRKMVAIRIFPNFFVPFVSIVAAVISMGSDVFLHGAFTLRCCPGEPMLRAHATSAIGTSVLTGCAMIFTMRSEIKMLELGVSVSLPLENIEQFEMMLRHRGW